MSGQETNRFTFAQAWWLLVCLTALGSFVAYDRAYLAAMVEADRSYISLVIVAAFLGATLHAAWHILAVSKRIEMAHAALSDGAFARFPGPVTQAAPAAGAVLEPAGDFVGRFIAAIARQRSLAGKEAAAGEAALVVDIYADRLRNPSETGWYLVDILIRLGLVGTIIGFIIVLGALAEGPPPTGDNIQALLISMSGGMGTALYTTLSGLVCASVLGAQHMILSRATEHLIALLIDLKAAVMNDASAS